MEVKVLALDLERTLIDNALSGRPRPGLSHFLTFCNMRFGRVAVFSTVEEADAREVLADLAERGHVPTELLARLEFVEWSGEYKDLAFVPGVTPAEVLLLDDDPGWVRADQRGQWVAIAGWEGGPDSELSRIQARLCELTRDESRLSD
ncbi:MAG: NIF family HAD-type phosphatase [Gemmataceae bacterium]